MMLPSTVSWLMRAVPAQRVERHRPGRDQRVRLVGDVDDPHKALGDGVSRSTLVGHHRDLRPWHVRDRQHGVGRARWGGLQSRPPMNFGCVRSAQSRITEAAVPVAGVEPAPRRSGWWQAMAAPCQLGGRRSTALPFADRPACRVGDRDDDVADIPSSSEDVGVALIENGASRLICNGLIPARPGLVLDVRA